MSCLELKNFGGEMRSVINMVMSCLREGTWVSVACAIHV